MPTYDYVCEKCGHEFEKFQPIADRPLAVCPQDLCGKKKWGKGKVARRISAGAGLIFKGSGFYITDYRSENYKQSAKKESDASGGAGKAEKTSGAAETKSPAKPDTKPSGKSPGKSAKAGD